MRDHQPKLSFQRRHKVTLLGPKPVKQSATSQIGTGILQIEVSSGFVDKVWSLIEMQVITLEIVWRLVVKKVCQPFSRFTSRVKMHVTDPTSLPAERNRRRVPTGSFGLLQLFSVLLFLFAPLSYAGVGPQGEQKEPLGSLTSVGEVYVNDSPVSGESTIFTGDRVRTGQSSNATFTVSGKGTLKISPQSQVLFSGNYQFTAELEAGTVVLNSISRPPGITLRIGSLVLVPSIREESATASVDRAPDGSFTVLSLNGGVGVLTLDAKAGQFIQSGQSLRVSLRGELSPVLSSGRQTTSGPLGSARTARSGNNLHSGWLLLGLAGAGAAAAAAELAHGGGRQSVSPSAP
jgi:hypothetical protein